MECIVLCKKIKKNIYYYIQINWSNTNLMFSINTRGSSDHLNHNQVT